MADLERRLAGLAVADTPALRGLRREFSRRLKQAPARRAALVATVPPNRQACGGRGDARRTLAVCRLLALDRDDMVVKAMSWALRDLAIRDAKAVAEFLVEHREKLASRVIREVKNKLTTGLKNPRR